MDIYNAARADFITRMLRSHMSSLTGENGTAKEYKDPIERRRNAFNVIDCNAAISYYQSIREKEGDGRQTYFHDLIYKSFTENKLEANMKTNIETNAEDNVKDKLSKNTIAYCMTAIICCIIIAFSYLRANRYETDGRAYTVDKYNQEIILNDLR